MSESSYCDKCGQPNRPQAKFCGHCGEEILTPPKKKNFLSSPTFLTIYFIFFLVFPFNCYSIFTASRSSDESPTPLFVPIFLAVLYGLPTLLAFHREHHQKYAISLLNFFSGWTMIGWVISIIWAATAVKQKTS